MRKIKVETIIRLKPYGAIKEAVEAGATWGVHRAYKYDGVLPPDDEVRKVVDNVVDGIMQELGEILDFGDES